MGSGPLSAASQDPDLMPHLEPTAKSDATNYARELSDSTLSNISEDVARPPSDSFADAPHMLLDRRKKWIKERKRPTVDRPKKRKRRREGAISKANRKEDSSFDSRPAMGDRMENCEHLVNLVSNRPSALPGFKPEPTSSAEFIKKEKLHNDVSHSTTPVGSLDEDSLDYFFVISTLRFPDHRNYRNDVDGLEKIFFDNFKPLGWPPKLEGKARSSITGRINAIGPGVWHSLLIEICRRNMAFLWVFTSSESIELRLREQKKFSEWLTKQLGFYSEATNSATHVKIPINNILSKYHEGMTMKVHILPSEWLSDPTAPKFHLEWTTQQHKSGLRTKCALDILINYYKSLNVFKWSDLFGDSKSFVRLFAKLKVIERHTRFGEYAAKKQEVEVLEIFPWEAARRYEPEIIENVRKKGTTLATRAMNIRNFVANHKS